MDGFLGVLAFIGIVVAYVWIRRGISKAVGVGLNKTVLRAGVEKRKKIVTESALFRPAESMGAEDLYAAAKAAVPFGAAASLMGASVTLTGERGNVAIG